MADSLTAYFLVGPTASGKTEVAHAIAEEDGFDIVSADSMLVYSGMDTGTAKPTPCQRASVKYWCLDIASPAEPFSAARYRALALEALRAVRRSGRRAIVVGGSGLYIKGLTHRLADTPTPDPEVRERLLGLQRAHGIAGLQDALRALGTQFYDSLRDKDNPRRLIRAIELAQRGMMTPSEDWRERGPGTPLAGLHLDRALLHKRIRERVLGMYDGGLLDEAAGLAKSGALAGPTASKAIGYAEALDCVAGKCTRDQAVGRTVARTNRLAKRQMTWLKYQTNVCWVHVTGEMTTGEVAGQIRRIWGDHGPTAIEDCP